jgi:hypothetical protein
MAGLFESLLSHYERERHTQIVADAHDAARSARPGIRRPSIDGFVLAEDAARTMGIDIEQLVVLVNRGTLEHFERWGEVWVRPAVVTTLAVRR